VAGIKESHVNKPEIHHVNGYQLIKGDDFKWRIYTDDHPVGEPYDLFTEARDSAERLEPRRPSRR
jgi:hypothetical protein